MSLEVPTSTFALPAGLDPSAVVALLDDRFDLELDPAATVRSTVVDTADRRLGAQGLELTLEGGRAAPTLVLRDGAGSPPVTAPVVPRRRWMAGDLPPGPLHDRVAPVVGVRALLPLAALRADVRSLRVRNGDGKTVVRLRLTAHATLDDGDRPVPLESRLDVQGVLGYPRARARVVAALTGDAGLAEASGTLADEAIAAAGGDPSGLRTKVRVRLAPHDRTGEAARRVLRDLAGMVEANLPGVLADDDTEFLHDLRVAVRRSRSVLRELRNAFPPEDLGRHRRALRWVQEVTGPTRDLDVQLLGWDALVADVPADRRAALDPVLAVLVDHREAALRALRRALRSASHREAWASYRAFLDADPGPGTVPPDAARPVAEVAGRRIRKVYARMVREGGAIDDTSPAADLHELRKRGKELRYLLELFGSLWPDEAVRPLVRSLKGLQDVLGTHQDREVQAAHLRGLATELAGRPGGPDALLALGVLVDRLESDQREARARFAERFASFASPAQAGVVTGTFG